MINDVVAAASELQAFLQKQKWRFCIIGGLAVLRWGRVRTTQDVGISLFSGLGSEETYIDPLLARFPERISDARQFAQDSRVVLIQATNGIPIDIALAAFPFEEQVIARATPFEFAPGHALITASLEDLLVLKAFAGRAHDWADVEGMAIRQAGQIDWDFVETQLQPLCELKESTDALTRLAEIRSRHDS